MKPFQYPSNSERKYSPKGYEDYTSFKPWLRDEFDFRCIYCLFRETWYANGNAAFGVEHFVPKSSQAGEALETTYDNLFYACNRCNTMRGTKALVDAEIQIDPDKLGQYLCLNAEGEMEGKTKEGRFLIDILGLNSDLHVEWRECLAWLAKEFDPNESDEPLAHLFLFFFTFPTDLPNLGVLRPPGRNSTNTDACWFQVKERGELPAYY